MLSLIDNNTKINILFSQLIEDLKQSINVLNEKLHSRQTLVDQLNTELKQLKDQSQVCDYIY